MRLEKDIRYSRLIAVERIGEEGLRKLNESRVLVVGCGALGSMVAMQLAGSGVGHLRIVDSDTIEISNLQRQFFFQTEECGRKKVDVLAARIHGLNPTVEVEICDDKFSVDNASALLEECDFVVEATDNRDSMVLIDKICEEKGVGCVLAGVKEFSGQVMTCRPGTRRFRDIFVEDDSESTPCLLPGVIGSAAALAASVEASETIKSLIGMTPLLTDRLFLFDLLTLRFLLIDA